MLMKSSARDVTKLDETTYKILIISSSRATDSFTGSLGMEPISAIRACCKIFWVLREILLMALIKMNYGALLIEDESTKDSEPSIKGERFCNSKATHAQGKGEGRK